MKKILKAIMVVFVGVLLVTALTSKANSNLVEAIDGASIRTEGEQGLRFYAKLDESVKDNKHGFYLIYGVATVNELETALSNKIEDKAYLNDQVIFEVEVPGVTQDDEYSVVLTQIPKEGYFQNITVIPYVVVNDKNVYPNNGLTRSVAAVALNMANKGINISEITDVEAILETPLKKYKLNSSGNYEISSGVYETNHVNLRNEFIKDWNTKFETNWTEIVAADFWENAKEGLEDVKSVNNDLKDSNIYKFFNDPLYKNKWEWFLDYIISQCGITHASRQAIAIKGNGTNGNQQLWHADHLSYSIANFFNQAHEDSGMTAINFKELHRYNFVKEHNDKIYIDATTYEFYNVGDVITVPDALSDKTGYTFGGYKVGEDTLAASVSYTITDDVMFVPKYNLINYTVKFYDGEVELSSLQKTYTIESGLNLGATSKEGFSFLGWYDNENLEGTPVTIINQGVTGNKVYYAKYIAGHIVTYDLGEYGNVSSKTKSGLFEELILDWKEAYGRVTLTKENFYNESYFNPANYQFNFFVSEPYASKYSWLKEYLLDVAEELDYDKKADLINNVVGVWRINIHAFFNENVYTHETASLTSMNFTDSDHLNNGFWKYTEYTKVSEVAVPGGNLFDSNLVNSCCPDHEFDGWYLDEELTIPITKLPDEIHTNITIYAKWNFNPTITYDYGSHGYISDTTKQDLFADFAEDYRVALGRGATTQELIDDFFGRSGLPTEADPLDYAAYGDITIIFRYENNKWAWLQDYILDLASRYEPAIYTHLSDGNSSHWRSNLHSFWNETFRSEWPVSMDFTDQNKSNSFWKDVTFAEYNKVVEFNEEITLLDGSTINSWHNKYEFGGWYDNPTFTGDAITLLPENIVKSLVLYAKWNGPVIITYDLGEYGYISDETKLTLFEDFVTDWRAAFGRSKSVEDMMANFAGEGLASGAVIETITEYKNGKWQWLFDYILDLALEANFKNAQNLADGHTGSWRGSMHGFWNDVNYKGAAGYLDSMDFTVAENGYGFWRYSPYGKIVVELDGSDVLLNLNSVKSWDSNYEAVGFVDKDDNPITNLEGITESMTIYVKWQLK